MIDFDHIKAHLFDRDYMSGVERDANRVKSTGEVFTPDPAVKKMLDLLPVDFFTDPTKTAIDPACGDGQWLAMVLWQKLQSGHDFKTALSTIYGVDIMSDNVHECRRRLLCGYTELQDIVDNNILVGNALDPTSRLPNQLDLDYNRMIELFATDKQKIDLLKEQLSVDKNKRIKLDPSAAQLFTF